MNLVQRPMVDHIVNAVVAVTLMGKNKADLVNQATMARQQTKIRRALMRTAS
jgi:hypothetical protein